MFFVTHKQFHRTVADPDSSDLSRLYPNEHYRPYQSVTRHSNSIPPKYLLSAPKEVFTSKILSLNNNNPPLGYYTVCIKDIASSLLLFSASVWDRCQPSVVRNLGS